jgi:hypothetical protein
MQKLGGNDLLGLGKIKEEGKTWENIGGFVG